MAEPYKNVGFVWVQGSLLVHCTFLIPFLLKIIAYNMYNMSITYFIVYKYNMPVYHQSQITPILPHETVDWQEPAAAKAEDPKAKLLGNPRRFVAPILPHCNVDDTRG